MPNVSNLDQTQEDWFMPVQLWSIDRPWPVFSVCWQFLFKGMSQTTAFYLHVIPLQVSHLAWIPNPDRHCIGQSPTCQETLELPTFSMCGLHFTCTMMRSTASTIFPALFNVPSTFWMFWGCVSFWVVSLSAFTVQQLMKHSVVPLSNNASWSIYLVQVLSWKGTDIEWFRVM